MGFDDFSEAEPGDEEERPRDPQLDKAIAAVVDIFDRSPARVFYSRQIETQLERQFFHWITNRALAELANAGQLQRMPTDVQGQTVNFYANKRHRYSRREQRDLAELLGRIFDPDFTQAVGLHAEMMFDSALSRHGFSLTPDRNITSWQGKEWTETRHNLDRICVRDGIAYGVEIKNTQNYIPLDELRIKLRLCRHLDLKPLFIMRFAPKSYINEIWRAGGFSLLFEHQIYPMGHRSLLEAVSTSLNLKVQSPRDIPEGHMNRLVTWHTAQLARQHGTR